MARIAGIELPNKPIEIALTYIYGIGRQNSLVILEKAGIKLGTRTNDLTESEINEIRKILENEYMIEGKLRSFVQLNIKRLMDIIEKVYRLEVSELKLMRELEREEKRPLQIRRNR